MTVQKCIVYSIIFNNYNEEKKHTLHESDPAKFSYYWNVEMLLKQVYDTSKY